MYFYKSASYVTSHNFLQYGFVVYCIGDIVQELKDKRLRIALSLKSSQENIRYHQLVDEHFSSVKLADEAFSLLRQAVSEQQKVDELIKQAKLERKTCRTARDFAKADDITQLIAQLAKIYSELKQERDSFNTRTHELNNKTAKLREIIRTGCGAKGMKWHERLQTRKKQN